jgi:hypothetical protein
LGGGVRVIRVRKQRERAYVCLFGRETLWHEEGESVFHVGYDTFSREPAGGIKPQQVRDAIADLEKMLERIK